MTQDNTYNSKDITDVSTEEVFDLPSANMSDKDYSRTMYEKKKRSPERFSDVQKRQRKIRFIKRSMKKIENRRNIEPHVLGDDIFSFISTLPDYVKQFSDLTTDYDANLVHVENLFIFLYHMSNSKNMSDYICSTVTYIKLYMKTSVSKLLIDFCEHLSNADDDDTFVEPHSWDAKTLQDSWSMLRSNPIFPKISFLITAAMASSICSIKELNLDFAGIKLIHLEAMKQQVTAFDIVDAAISTFSWIHETGWCCLKEKSLSPILYSDQRLRNYTEDCNYVISMADALKSGNIEDIAEFERKMDKCIRTTCEMQKVTPSVTIKELLQRKYSVLVGIKNDLIAKRKNTAYREAPIGFSIHGESSIGKSDVAELTMKHALNAMGVSDSKEGIITLNECDKYDSTYTSDVLGVFIDDAANSTSSFAEKSPTQKYIQMFNNMAAQAVKAELNEKGCVFINFLVGVITTNVKTLDANLYSNYPVAVLRRFYHVHTRVSDLYQAPGGKSLNLSHPHLNREASEHIVDVWLFDIEEVIPNGTSMGVFKIVHYQDSTGKMVPCKDLNLGSYLEAVVYLSRRHRLRQTKQLTRNKIRENMQCCKRCCMIPQYCSCAVDVSSLDPHSIAGDYVRNAFFSYLCSQFTSMFYTMFSFFLTDCSFMSAIRDEVMTMCCEFSLIDNLETSCALIPKFVTDSQWFRKHIVSTVFYRRKWLFRAARARKFLGILAVILFVIYACTFHYIILRFISIILFLFICCDALVIGERDKILSVIDNNAGKILLRYGRFLHNNWRKTAAFSVAAIAGIATLLHIWNKTRRDPHALGDLTLVDKRPNWFGFTFGNTQSNGTSSSVNGATCSQLASLVKKNLAWCRFSYASGAVNKCNVFFLRKSVLLMPRHVFHEGGDMRKPLEDLLECVLYRNNSPGGQISFKVRFSMSYRFPNLDLVGVYLPNCPDVADMKKWFPNSLPTGRGMCEFVGMMESLEYQHSPLSVEYTHVSHRYLSMPGGKYYTSMAQKGACMSSIISDTTSPSIVGFHIGGDASQQLGICLTVTRAQLEDAENWFSTSGVHLSANTHIIPQTQYGKEVICSPHVNPKAKYILGMTSSHVVEVLGSTKLRASQNSEVEQSLLSPYIEKHMGISNKWGPPQLNPNWAAFNVNIEQFSNPGVMFDPLLLDRAIIDWMKPLGELMVQYTLWEKTQTISTFRPLSMKETILGIDGVRFIDAMPMNTGIGFPIFGKKNKIDSSGKSIHFDEIRDGQILVDRVPKQHILDEYNRMIECYERNLRAYPVTSATLKDEPTLIGKEKVRVFQAAPVALGILIRQYFLPIARFLCCHPLQAESAVGVNAFGPEWLELMTHSEKYMFDDNMLGWDYSKYDVRMNSQITRAVWNTFIDLAAIGGYSKKDLNIMRAMVVDICHPLIDMNGTMLMALSMNTSGNNMTVYVNSLAGSLYVRMGFFSIYPHENDFRSCVALLTYGDDAIGSVKEEYKNFNFISYKNFLAKHGMKLTLPSKTDEEIEFLKKNDVDFLKRKSNYIHEIGTSIGKLDEDSIFKSLHSNIRSHSTTAREIACSCVEGALHEWFAFGRDHYEMRREQLHLVCSDLSLPVHALSYTFDDRVQKWLDCYTLAVEPHTLSEESLDTILGEKKALTPRQLYAYLCGGSLTPRQPHLNQPATKKTHLIGSSNSPADKGKSGPDGHIPEVGRTTRSSKKGKTARSELNSPPLSPNTVTADLSPHSTGTRPTLGSLYHKVKCALGILNALEKSISQKKEVDIIHQILCAKGILASLETGLQDILIAQIEEAEHQFEDSEDDIKQGPVEQFKDADEPDIEPHSLSEPAQLSNGVPANPVTMSGNVEFEDAMEGYMDWRGEGVDALRSQVDESYASLGDFFMRPIKVAKYLWAVNTSLNISSLDPWSNYFQDPRVVNKIAKFRMLACNLHIKVTINGNNFIYGRALVSYRPLPLTDTFTRLIVATSDLVEASQRPHIYLNPTNSQGGDLLLPFFTPNNMLDITLAEWSTMGRIDITSFGNLSHVNGTGNPIEISVFAWAENVQLTGLTDVNPLTISPQSDTEYAGILSKPASVVAKTASYFTKIPYLGKFAMATEIGAGSIARMAALFGFSKPPILETPPIQPVAMQSYALCDGRANVQRLSYDNKQELTIDPIVAGLESKDEMTILSLSMRESYLGAFDWPVGLPSESLLFTAVVDPCLHTQVGSDSFQSAHHFTATCFAAFPFKWWRGSLKYRFQVVCSTFHKGRLKVVFDPVRSNAIAPYNTAYTQIIDISECPDFTITVGWGQTTTFREHLPFQQNPGTYVEYCTGVTPATPLTYASNNQIFGNGVISIYVVNDLTSSNYSVQNNVQVLVSVSSGDDFEVFQMTDNLQGIGYRPRTELSAFSVAIEENIEKADIEPQSSPEKIMNMGNPVQSEEECRFMGLRTEQNGLANKIHFGEAINSIRSVLKRATLHEILQKSVFGGQGSVRQYSWFRPMFPTYGGYTLSTPGDSRSIQATSYGDYIFANNTPLNYFTSAYGGWRGGIRYHFDTSFEPNYSTAVAPRAIQCTNWAVTLISRCSEVYAGFNQFDETNYDAPFPPFSRWSIREIASPDTALGNYANSLKNCRSGCTGQVRWGRSPTAFSSIEVPYYSEYRFCPAKLAQATITNKYQPGIQIDTLCSVSANPSYAYKSVSAAEDFQLLFYLSPPVFYREYIPDVDSD